MAKEVNYRQPGSGYQQDSPNFITPKGAAGGKKKTVIGPGPLPGNKQKPQGDYLMQQEETQERE